MSSLWFVPLLLAVLPTGAGVPIAPDDFVSGKTCWVGEQMPGGKWSVDEGALTIEDALGCTIGGEKN